MEAEAAGELLGRHPLWRGVAPEKLAPRLRGIAVRRVQRGVLLHTPGVSPGPGHLFLVLRGRLRAYQITAGGRELLLELIAEGGFDGLLSVAGRRGHFTAADEDSMVASLALPALERLMAQEPVVAGNLLRLIVERLEGREVQLEAIALHDPARQLARQLLALGETLGDQEDGRTVLRHRITHQMLADMLGLRRETVTLHLPRLSEAGAVRVAGGRFHLDVDRLRALVDAPDI